MSESEQSTNLQKGPNRKEISLGFGAPTTPQPAAAKPNLIISKKRKRDPEGEAWEAKLNAQSKYFIELVNGDEQDKDKENSKHPTLQISADTNAQVLNELLNKLLQAKQNAENSDESYEFQPFSFYLEDGEPILSANSIKTTIIQHTNEEIKEKVLATEEVPLKIVYHPQALFRVRPVTRCTASLPGHSESILCVRFSPDGKLLASGSGDKTARIWDINTQTPMVTCSGHGDWVLAVEWSPDGKKLATGSHDGVVKIWEPNEMGAIALNKQFVTKKKRKIATKEDEKTETAKEEEKPAEAEKSSEKPKELTPKTKKKQSISLKGHKKWITALAWEPYHLNPKCNRVASSSKDGTIKVWDVITGKCEFTLSGHTKAVTSIRWNGDSYLYSTSEDCTMRVWTTTATGNGNGCIKVLTGHSHWINTLTLSTDYVIRRGAFDHTCQPLDTQSTEQLQQAALKRYTEHTKGSGPLRIVTGSDDNTLCLWEPDNSDKPIARLVGHKGVVNCVNFSPDGRWIASASFDKSIKIWEAKTGKFVTTLRGHVGRVYQCCWSGDSRLLVSSSQDSTAKVWNVKEGTLLFDLPGHYDEVYAVDWSLDGQAVASAGKDRLIKIWKH